MYTGSSFTANDCHLGLPRHLSFSSISCQLFCRACQEFASTWTTSWSQVHQTNSTFVTSVQSCSGSIRNEVEEGSVPFCYHELSTLNMGTAQKDLSHQPVRWLPLSMPQLLETDWSEISAWPGKLLQEVHTRCGYTVLAPLHRFLQKGCSWIWEHALPVSFGQGERTPGVFQPQLYTLMEEATGVAMQCVTIQNSLISGWMVVLRGPLRLPPKLQRSSSCS